MAYHIISRKFRFVIKDDIPPIQCKYMFTRGELRGQQCARMAVPYEHFCANCAQKIVAARYNLPPLPLPTNRSLHLSVMDVVDDPQAYATTLHDAPGPVGEVRILHTEIPDLTQDFKEPPNVGLIASDDVTIPAHMGVLLEVDFFAQYAGQETVELDVDSDTLKNCVDLLYGKTVNFPNWMTAFDLFGFFNEVGLDWDMNNVVCAFNVTAADLDSYMMQLGELYDGGIPDVVRKKTDRFRTRDKTPPPQPIQPAPAAPVIQMNMTPLSEGWFCERSHNVILRPNPDGTCLCIGYLNQGQIVPLTPELRAWCTEQGFICM